MNELFVESKFYLICFRIRFKTRFLIPVFHINECYLHPQKNTRTID